MGSGLRRRRAPGSVPAAACVGGSRSRSPSAPLARTLSAPRSPPRFCAAAASGKPLAGHSARFGAWVGEEEAGEEGLGREGSAGRGAAAFLINRRVACGWGGRVALAAGSERFSPGSSGPSPGHYPQHWAFVLGGVAGLQQEPPWLVAAVRAARRTRKL